LEDIVTLLGNIIWLILGGLLISIVYFLGGLVFCVTIVGIPFGLKLFALGRAVLSPFGKEVKPTPGGSGMIATIFNILWLVLFGWEIALAHFLGGLLYAITIIGIPIAKQHFKLAKVGLFPFSYKLE
jgi:uncharacterized membrane protein YccF (DUF307 family)